VEQTERDFEEVEGEIVARTHEIARWRETGEIAYERRLCSPLNARGRENRQDRRDAGGRAASVGRRASRQLGNRPCGLQACCGENTCATLYASSFQPSTGSSSSS
jgi:hypothetical protein